MERAWLLALLMTVVGVLANSLSRCPADLEPVGIRYNRGEGTPDNSFGSAFSQDQTAFTVSSRGRIMDLLTWRKLRFPKQ